MAYNERRDARRRQGGRRRKKKNKGCFTYILSVLFSVLILYSAVIGCYIGYTYLNENEDDNFFEGENQVAKAFTEAVKPVLPTETNFVVFGTDEDGTRTDTIMVLNYNSKYDKLTLISVPRDSYIYVSDEDFDAMCSEYPEPGHNGMKINTVYHYAPEDDKIEMSTKYVGKLLGIDIDYYALLDFDAFKYLVDSVGGIEYDVPIDMHYYDPEYDFSIDLDAGLQTLNGEQAEQLVRFRKGYSNQDLGRVETQQNFVKALIKQLASKENIINNPTSYITAAIKYVDTNAGITDVVKYFSVLDSIGSGEISNFTVPGTSAVIDNSACYQVDEDTLDYLIKSVDNGTFGKTHESISSVGKNIVVLNGGYTSGLAGIFRGRLQEAGFTVGGVADFDGLKSDITKIYVKQAGEGQDLQEYFTDSLIIVGEEMPADGDIVVVLGVGETA